MMVIMPYTSSFIDRIGLTLVTDVMWIGGVVVGSRTRNRQIVGSIPGLSIVGQRPWASCSHQCASVYQAV